MPETLNEKALDAICERVVEVTGCMIDREDAAEIVSCFLSSLPAGDYAGLVERLRTHSEKNEVAGSVWWETPEVCEEAATAITSLVAERDSLLKGHRILNVSGARLQDRAEAAEARVKAMDEALSEVEGCFDAAFAEGLQERLNDEADRSLGTLYDLVTRRLLSAHDASRRARAVKEGR